jgi:ribonucleoside-diphosphate reductase alpha chain
METRFLDEFSREVWETTYKNIKDETVNDTLKRVAKAAASVEKTAELKSEWEDKFYELLTDFKVTAGGRILANAGTDWKGTTLMNCFVGPKPKYDQDSLEGIIATLLAQAQTLKSEGGWGMNFSFIRPRGAFIRGIGVESPGSVKYMEIFDKTSDVITAGSGLKAKKKEAKGKIRKGAMMGILDVWHPDIEEFVTAKLTPGRLSKFNISVNCSNEFMDRIIEINDLERELAEIADYSQDAKEWEKDKLKGLVDILKMNMAELDKWELVFPDTSYKSYKTEWDGNLAAWKAKGFPVIAYKTISAKALWELVINSTYTRNDPGVLFLDIANKTHAWNYGGPDSHIAATNPCGEQCLPFGAVCNLASFNLTQFVDFKAGKFDLDKIKKYVPWAVRFLDNINDLTNAPLPEYEVSIKYRRRIGLGVMGWGSALYMLKTRFASKKAENIKAELMQTLTHTAVNASINLAIEKGKFRDCDPVKHAQSEYWRQIGLDEKELARMATHGIRNSALFSNQPTGNTGVLANIVSGGIEPAFLHEYIRTVIIPTCPEVLRPLVPKYWEGEFKETEIFKFSKEGDEQILRGEYNGIVYKIDKNRGLTKEVPCIDYGVRFLKAHNEWDAKADWAVTTANLSVDEHIRDMQGFGMWVDSSMSKTVNIPNDYPYDKFKDIYLNAYKTGFLKGITTYRDGTMATVLSSAEKKEEVKSDVIPDSLPPKRPKTLAGDLHHFTVGGHKYYVAVGLYGSKNQPYEIFTGINEEKKNLYIPKASNSGEIRKEARGTYTFIDEEKDEYKLNNGHSDDTADALTRMISAALRHGTDVQFVVHQLEKVRGPLVSFSKVLARTLKKYVKDGAEIKGEECSACGGKLIRQEGCSKCVNCGSSKCG